MTLLVWAGAVILLLFALAPYVPRSAPFIDLPSHFTVQAAVAAMALLLLAIVLRAHSKAYILLVIAYFLCLYQFYPYLLAAREKAAQGATLKILHANVWIRNHDTAPLEELVAREAPDIIVASEVHAPFARMFGNLRAAYPHQHVLPNDHSSYGIAVASKYPLLNLEQKALAVPDIPSVFFQVEKDEKTVDVAVMHTANPVRRFAPRDAEFEALAAWYRDRKPEHLVVVGDLNATPYCHGLKKAMREMHLQDPRARRGIMGTYPAQLPSSALRLPIDHVLATPTLSFADFRIGPPIGSDHLPVIASLNFR